MKFRQTALPNDLQYCMDCAIENSEINAFDYAVVSLFGETERVDQIWNTPRFPSGRRGWAGGRGIICLDIDAYAHQIAAGLPSSERKALFAFNLNAEPKRLMDCANFLAEFNFTDETIGGSVKPYRKVRRCDRDFNPTKALARHLYSPSAIRRYVKRTDDSVPHYRLLNVGLRRLPWPSSVSDGAEIIEWMTAQTNDIRERQRIAEQRFAEKLAAEHGQKRPPIPKKIRRSLTKAAGIAVSVLGAEDTSAFIRGRPIEIRGQTAVFEAHRGRSLSKNGHGAMSVDVKSLEGKTLASLCVYFDGMPALDQLAALKMHVDSGDEAAVLSNANLFKVTADGMNHPIVMSHKKYVAPQMDGMGGWEIAARNEHQLQRDAIDRYWDATKPHYVRAVMDYVWGRDAKRVKEIFKASRR